MILVLGIDAATWTIVKPNLYRLPAFRKLCELGEAKTIVLTEKPVSPSIWCSMFCGKTYDEHGHDSFVSRGRVVSRNDIKVDFIWDVLSRRGRDVKALNIPFVIPPFSFGVEFEPIGFGLPSDPGEWQEELETVTATIRQLMAKRPDVLIAAYTLLDRIQHFHWGEECVLEWYERVDSKIDELVFTSGFLDDSTSKLIVISDHGFCSFGEARVQTLPAKSEWGRLKGDHHEDALLITVNMDYPIEKPQDVFYALSREFEQAQ